MKDCCPTTHTHTQTHTHTDIYIYIYILYIISVRATCPLSRKLFKLGEPDMQDIAGEAEMNS